VTLESLGWNSHFQNAFAQFESQGLVPARVAREDKQSYVVYGAGRATRASVSGAFRYRAAMRADYPAVGDWVIVHPLSGEDAATIHAVLPRRSSVERKIAGERIEAQVVASNVDALFVCAGLDHDFNVRRIERYLTLAYNSGVTPIVLLTKADLCADAAARVSRVESIAQSAQVVALSVVDGRGMDRLRACIGPGVTTAMVGSSGVGKSSLINTLLGRAAMQVGAVRSHDSRGRHTTTHRELLLLPGGGVMIDTPGMRELGLWGDGDGVDSAFRDIEELASTCRFRDCAHEHEPGCAVHTAIARGDLDPARLSSYRKQLAELRFQERKENPAAARAEKERWIAIHKSARRWMREKYRS
jgi:ribosome biogenesis GTPase